MATVNDAADAAGIEWKKHHNDRRRRRRKEDKLSHVREGCNRTPWTLAQAVVLCAMCFFRGKNGAFPYAADSKEQIAWWEQQERDKIGNRKRTIRMNIAGCPLGTREFSPTINEMQTNGKTEEVSKKRKREGIDVMSRAQTGHDQKNSVEGVAIHLLLVYFRSVISNFDRNWEVKPVFDFLEADFMMKRKDWESGDAWVPMQMKSVSDCIKGKQVSYSLTHGEYPNVFCVCVGLLGFVHRTDDVTGPNDIANASDCTIGEIWNIGSCSDIELSMGPTFGVPYSKFPASRRLHFPGAADEAKRTFAEALLHDIEKWPTRLEHDQILYEFNDTINSNVMENHKTEKKGFKVVDAAMRASGMRVDPVWRQGECVDYAIESVDTGESLVFISGKTCTVNNGDDKQRSFPLSDAPNKRFCDVVVASYSGMYHRVAVMSRDTAYVERTKRFCWNENDLKTGVRVFDDIRNPETGKAFADYVRSFGGAYLRRCCAAQKITNRSILCRAT
jgi:hypothetical protein